MEYLRHVKQRHERDLACGYGSVDLPFALYRPEVPYHRLCVIHCPAA